jgi:hypothetical protein
VEVVELIDVLSQCDPGFELGWEAGIRTPITCSRARRCTLGLRRFVPFCPAFATALPVCFPPFRWALRNLSLCAHPRRAESHTSLEARDRMCPEPSLRVNGACRETNYPPPDAFGRTPHRQYPHFTDFSGVLHGERPGACGTGCAMASSENARSKPQAKQGWEC